MKTDRARRPRPFTTTYFRQGKVRLFAHACTSMGAAKAAAQRLLNGEFDSAEIYTSQGIYVASLARKRREVNISISGRF